MIDRLVPPGPGGDWTTLAHGGDVVMTERMRQLVENSELLGSATLDEKRNYAILWLDRRRSKVGRAATVRVKCCPNTDGNRPVVAGLYRVPGVGLVIENSYIAANLIDENDVQRSVGIGGRTVVVADVDAIDIVCPGCEERYWIPADRLVGAARGRTRQERTITLG